MTEPGPGFDDFVAARGAALMRFAYLLCGDRGLAEDLVQDALVKALRRWDRVTAADLPEAYVRRILLNEHLGWRRRRSSSELPSPLPTTPPAGGGEHAVPDGADARAERDRIWKLLGRLPQRQRAVLVLRYYEALPDAQIGQLLGCAEGTVRSLAARAFATLRGDPLLLDSASPTNTGTGGTP